MPQANQNPESMSSKIDIILINHQRGQKTACQFKKNKLSLAPTQAISLLGNDSFGWGEATDEPDLAR